MATGGGFWVAARETETISQPMRILMGNVVPNEAKKEIKSYAEELMEVD